MPRARRYENVLAEVDSGFNELKRKVEDNQINARFHRSENFRRVKPAGLVKLVQEVWGKRGEKGGAERRW